MHLRVFTIVLLVLFIQKVHGQAIIFDQYLNFNGNDIAVDGDYVEIADNSSLDFDAATGFTIQFWLNPLSLQTGNGTHQGLVTKKTNSGLGYGVFWNVNGTGGRIQISLNDGNSRTISSNYINNINTYGWLHVTAVIERNSAPAMDTAFLYFNGSLEVKDDIPTIGDVSNAQPMRFMNFAGNTSQNCAGGRLDDVRIWNVALTEKQIQRFYSEPIEEGALGRVNGKFSGKLSLLQWSHLMGYWPMEDLLGSVQITDESNNSNTGIFYEGNSGVACNASPCGPALQGGTIGTAPTAFVATNSGLWSSTATWGGNQSPDDDRHLVFINPGITVTVDANSTFTCEQLNIRAGGTLTSDANGIIQVVKYFDCDGTLDCKTAGTILFDQVGDHKIFGEGTLDFFNFTLFQNSQLQVETDPNSPVNIYGVLVHGDGRIRTSDNMILKVNKSNTARPYGLIGKIGVGAPEIVGTIKMEKQLSGTNAGWRQMSMPLAGTLADFTGLTLNDNSAPANEQNVFFWDNAQDISIPANNVGWTPASINAGQGKPYSIYLDAGDFSFDPTLTFEGEYNFGDTTYALTYYNDPGNPLTSGQTGYENGVGWNFIPNRYPSLLDVQQMITDNPLNYKPIHIWDANTQQYMAFTDNPGDYIVPYNNAGTNTAELAGAAIEPMQGFWVKTDNTENGAAFTVQDAWRSTDFGLNPHASLKTNALIQINVFAEQDSAWDGVGIALEENAHFTFDPKSDVYKFKSGNTVPSLYVQKDERFLQVGHYPITTNRIHLHFDAQPNNTHGFYHLNLEREVPNNKSFVVEDLFTGKRHNLSEASYRFFASGAQPSHRFIIHLVDANKAETFMDAGNKFITYLQNNEIVLENPFVNGPVHVRVYDMTGRMLTRLNTVIDQELRLPAPVMNGVIIVEVQHPKGTDRVKMTLVK